MDVVEITLVLLMAIGIGLILYFIFRESILISKIGQDSKQKAISFTDYEKYIIVDSKDIEFINDLIISLHNDPDDYGFDLRGVEIFVAEYDSNVIIKFNNIRFSNFNTLVHTLDNVAPENKVHHAKGILLNKISSSDSYYIYVDMGFDFNLIGKTSKNKNIYVDFIGDNADEEVINYSSELGPISRFNFEKFEEQIRDIKFRRLDLMPNTQQ